MSIAVIEPKPDYDRKNEAAFREEVRTSLKNGYDRRSDLQVPFGKRLQFTSAQGQVVTFGYNADGNFTIQQDASTPLGMASINYVSTVESGLESSIASLTVEVEAANDAAAAAAVSASSAATSATAAGTSATAANTSATNAATSATNAATSATAASSSASSASTSASSASTSASNAAGSASTAATQATNAANSATSAGNSATAASTSASNASTSATNAGVSESNASTSATNAASSQSAAAGSASAASTSASTASTQASNAATSASAASTSATTATTQASNASTSASSASTSAGNAAASATTAATQASNAAGSASTATTQASAASASATAAASSATLSATYAAGSQGSINSSATFADNANASGVPTNWVDWESGSSATRVTGIAPQPYAVTIPAGAGAHSGISQSLTGRVSTGWHVLEADVTLVSGALTGAGVTINADPGGVYQEYNLALATDPDTNGSVIGAGTTGRLYKFRKLVQVTRGDTYVNIYAMSHYSVHGSVASANSITWHRCAIRVASQAEIEARQAKNDLVTTNANVATNTSAIATETSARSALQTLVTARVGAKPASLLVNPAFSDYPVASGSIPPGWSNWANGTSSSRGTPGRVGAYAHIQDGLAASESGIAQFTRRMDPGKHNLDIAIERSAGTLTGAGVLVQYFDSSITFIGQEGFSFATVADTRGGVGVSVGYDYRTFRLAFTAPANTYYAHVYLMSHWSGFGSTATYNQIYWHQLDVTPVDYGTATVDALATTVATVDGKLSASYGLTVDANGRIASMKLLSNGATSSVKFTANTFQVFNGTSDEAPFEVVSGAVKIKSANVGTLNVGSGGLTIQSGSSGARIVMSNSVVEVYDSSNVRRVRMGVW